MSHSIIRIVSVKLIRVGFTEGSSTVLNQSIVKNQDITPDGNPDQ